MSHAPVTIGLGLLSHTNAGKTTLARSLLRRDIGEIGDRAHVTEVPERHVLIESPEGDVLALWDTPGFGDSVRLFARLQHSEDPLRWVSSQRWDRFTDRAFWSGQQAIRSARDECEVLLYVVNASESPEQARYVDAELQILEWLGKPVVLVLNQVGPQHTQARGEADLTQWRARLAAHPCIRAALTLDAFARCWVQEDGLLARVQELLRPELRPAAARLRAAWRARNLQVFERSMQVLAQLLTSLALDEEPVAEPDVQRKLRGWVSSVTTGAARGDGELGRAQQAMTKRLQAATLAASDALIRLHGLSGRAATEHLKDVARALARQRPADQHKLGLLGGLLSGAAGGVAADLAAGGLTFGAGALIGGVLGALGAHGLTRVYNLVLGRETGRLRWSSEFLTARAGSALLGYLAVAHFGRGRGEFVSAAVPEHWQDALGAMAGHAPKFDAAWELARKSGDRERAEQALAAAFEAFTRDVLIALYPEADDALSQPSAPRGSG